MAGPCVLYNGKKYTTEEFAAFIHDGELSNLISNNKLDPKKLTGEIPSVFNVPVAAAEQMSVITPEVVTDEDISEDYLKAYEEAVKQGDIDESLISELEQEDIYEAYKQRDAELELAKTTTPGFGDKFMFLHENLGRIRPSDFDDIGDNNQRKGNKAFSVKYLSSKAIPLDIKLGELSDLFGSEITPNDAIDYILDRESNPEKYKKSKDKIRKLNDAAKINFTSDKAYEVYMNLKNDAESMAALDALSGKVLSDEQVKIIKNHLNKKYGEADTTTSRSVQRTNEDFEGIEVINEEQAVEQEVEKISELFSTDVNKAVDNAKVALAKVMPEVKFVVHEDYDSYSSAVNEDVESGGTYDSKTNTIHINKRAATNTTVAHETFHAVLLNTVGTDAKAADVTKRMINALSKQLDNNPDLKEYLDNFVASYDENIKNEEKAAELFGHLAANYETLPKQSQSLIKRWMDAIAKMFGLKPFSDNEVVDFFNTLSEKVATGQEVTKSDVKVLGKKGKEISQSKKKQSSVIANKIKAAKSNGFSDAAVSQYLQNNGYTAEQVSKALIDYNQKEIQKAQKAEGIFLENTGSKFKNYMGKIRRNVFSKRGFKSKSQFLGIEQKIATVEYQLKIVANTASKFDKLISKYFDNITPEKEVMLDDARKELGNRASEKEVVNTAKEKIISDFDLFARGDKSVNLPIEFKVLANIARNQIDGLTEMLIKFQALPAESAENIRKNIGSYMNRSYEVFDNKDWAKKVKQDVVDNAKAYFRNEFAKIAEDKALKSGLTKEDVLNKMVDEQINKILNKDIENNFVNSGKEGSKDLSILKQKQDIPLEIRALMGEYTDPIQNYANTVYKMVNLVENAKYLIKLREKGLGVIFFEKGDVNIPEGFNHEIAADATKTLDPLGGLLTSKEIAENFKSKSWLDRLSNVASESSFYRYYMKTLRTMKHLKTIESLGTHSKNVLGAFEFALGNGHVDFKEYASAYKVIMNDLKNKNKNELDEKLLDYIKAGIINQNVGLGEIKNMFKDDDFEKSFKRRIDTNEKNIISKGLKSTKLFFNKAIKKLEDVYQAEDDLFKIIGFEIERNRYADILYDKKFADLNEDEKKDVTSVVTENIKNILPNYSRIPELGKFLKVIPVAGTFISFELESLRTSYNTVSLAFTEMKSDNPKSRKLGATRFAALAATQGFRYFLEYLLTSSVFGWFRPFFDDDEEEDAKKRAKRYLPEYAENSHISLVDLGKGKFSYIDLSASNPRSRVPRILEAFTSGEKPQDVLINSVKEILSPFVSDDILLSLITQLSTNKDHFGKPIYNEYDDPINIGKDIFKRIGEAIEPGSSTSVRKVLKSENKLAATIAQVTGYKIHDVEVGKQFYFKAKKTAEEALKAKDVYNDVFYKFEKGEATRDEHNEALAQASESLRGILEESNKDFESAVFFGANPDELSETLDKVRLSESDQVMSGEYENIKSKIPLTKEEEAKALEEAKRDIPRLKAEAKARKINLDELKRKAKEGN